MNPTLEGILENIEISVREDPFDRHDLNCTDATPLLNYLETYKRDFDAGIPRCIHQIWIGPDPEPAIWLDTWRKHFLAEHPGWEYRLWSEKEIDKLDLINRKLYDEEATYFGKADILRFELLYTYGGI